MHKSIWLFLLFILILTACNSVPAEGVADSVPTVLSSTKTAVPAVTNTTMPEAMETAVSPTNTPQPAPTATIAPTETPAFTIPRFLVEDRFTIYGEDAAIPRADNQFTDPGAVLFYDGQFHMFHNAFTGWPVPVDIVYSISDDGVNWRRVQEEPILTSSEVEFAGVAALASSALVLEDGTWVLYFYTWDDVTWPASASSIGMATAPDPLGPWMVAADPILEPGGSLEWDGTAVRTPSVIQTEDGFVMYYGGYDSTNVSIGRATSTDGINWEKENNPDTSSAPYAASDPVFSGSGEQIWDKTNAFQPHVQLTPDGWVMLYASATNVSRTPVNNRHGIAVSSDGIEWTRSSSPLFKPSEVRSGGNNIWFSGLVYAQDSYFVYVEVGKGNNTDIFVTTLAEPLIDE